MNYDELHRQGTLKSLPLRMKLTRAHGGAYGPSWRLQEEWKPTALEPYVSPEALGLLKLSGSDCCAVMARVVTWTGGRRRTMTKRPLVCLLSPVEPEVWAAIDSWFEAKELALEHANGQLSLVRLRASDRCILEARDADGKAPESDMLAGHIQNLLQAGQLEAEVAKQLQLEGPVTCAIVETPMLLRSMQSADGRAN